MLWGLVKQLHVALAVLTACSFCVRGYWMLARSPALQTSWSRWLPHVIDALLFLTGVTMAIGLSISPHAHPWLAMKLLAIVVYIVIGSIALKRGRSYRQRVVAFVLSVMVLAFVFAVALRHDPSGGLI
jgi:uncharacterized membrane protein SirB2